MGRRVLAIETETNLPKKFRPIYQKKNSTPKRQTTHNEILFAFFSAALQMGNFIKHGVYKHVYKRV